MSNDKPVTLPVAQKLSEISNSTDRKIAEIEAKLAMPTAEEDIAAKKGTSPSICGEPQSIDDYLEAMLGFTKKK